MPDNLPTKLRKEPLIDAIFELRFGTVSAALNEVLPGVLFNQLKGEKRIERLPAADLPKPIREKDPNLRFSPLTKLQWQQYVVLIGDRKIAIGCKYPYPGWKAFKETILNIVDNIQTVGIVDTLERCSVKYIDIIPSKKVSEQIAKTSLEITLGESPIPASHYSLRFEIPENKMIHIVNIVTSATATIEGKKDPIDGLIIDIETVQNLSAAKLQGWTDDELPPLLEKLHYANKKVFFDCLTKDTLNSLEPIYGTH